VIRFAAGFAMMLVVALVPSVALADAAGPTDYLTEITAVTPASVLDVVELDIVGGDAFVRIRVEPGHEVVVRGYLPDEEPYLRIDADGRVERNIRSYATYYNEDRDGTDDIPDVVDTAAAPEWEQVASGGEYAWHDHRAHWMGEEPLVGLDPGESLPEETIPIVVDGVEASVSVVTTLQPAPSRLPVVAGAFFGAALGLAGLALGRATAVLVAVALSMAALLAGGAQFLSLPASTGPSITWWLLPAVALVCSIAVIAVYGRSIWIETGLLAIAGLQLAVWGVQRRDHAASAYIPTSLPTDLDRFISIAALVGSVFVVLAAGRALAPVLVTGRRPVDTGGVTAP
jgi:hypothetical protein